MFIYSVSNAQSNIITGAERLETYLPLIKNKRVGLVTNHTGIIKNKSGTYTHILDSLISLGINVSKVFSPEHGFRGKADAGEYINHERDTQHKVVIFSLYGEHKKPTAEQLKNLDVMLFDLQDVGVRFYTYLSTLQYVMESCAKHSIPFIVLDRPNPNIGIIDGPVLEADYKSFVGLNPVPILYGMTIGEYAKMINGEKWLEYGLQAMLNVIPLKNYTRASEYTLPVKPSPNLPNTCSVKLYPSLCLFEGTSVSVGRGTEKPFQVFGSPYLDDTYEYMFIPAPNQGSKTPKHNGEICYGIDLSETEYPEKIELKWLLEAYRHSNKKDLFFNAYFTKLSGTKKLRTQIEHQLLEVSIRDSWKEDIEKFKHIRKKYLIYQP